VAVGSEGTETVVRAPYLQNDKQQDDGSTNLVQR